MIFEQFPILQKIDWIEHALTLRTATDLPERHIDNLCLRKKLPIVSTHWKSAQQIHDNQVAVVTIKSDNCQKNCDALCTSEKGVVLAISVADCCAIYAVDPVHYAIGLAHSGRQGTEKKILTHLVQAMTTNYDTDPTQLIIQLSPCIRPPHYPIDFVSEIKTQALHLGIHQLHDCNICTASNLNRYYSYRAEAGKTGRMMAVLSLKT